MDHLNINRHSTEQKPAQASSGAGVEPSFYVFRCDNCGVRVDARVDDWASNGPCRYCGDCADDWLPGDDGGDYWP